MNLLLFTLYTLDDNNKFTNGIEKLNDLVGTVLFCIIFYLKILEFIYFL